ncbi:MAG: hypothetical protein ACE3JK_01880 [Sporolactobacillus sp.]
MTENEKKLADNLAKRANELFDQNEDTQDVLNLVQAISVLKRS